MADAETTFSSSCQRPSFICVECGVAATELYKEFKGGIIKLSHCTSCNELVDKYVEFDSVLISVDILLHKSQAYRHVLFNQGVKIQWHLCIIYLLCDAYSKWSEMNLSNDSAKDFTVLEMQFYIMFLRALLELIVFFGGLGVGYLVTHRNTNQCSFSEVIRVILLSSFGKLFVIPSAIWGQNGIYLWLTRVFIFTSNSVALRVLLKSDLKHAYLIVMCGNIAMALFQYAAVDLQWNFIDN